MFCKPYSIQERMNFLDTTVVKQFGLATIPLKEPLVVNALDCRLLARVTSRTTPLQLSGKHHELISLFVIDSPFTPLILGHTSLIYT